MTQSPEQGLLNLLEDIFNTSCISISSTSISARSATNNEYRTTTLILRDARSASLANLVELVLQLLLSHPPFTHTSPRLLGEHMSRFFIIWTGDFDASSAVGSSTSAGQGVTPQQGLDVLADLRLSFQTLGEDGFKFVSELLLSCVHRLSPEAGGSRRSWAVTHAKAVDVLSQLLHSVPSADWLRQDKHLEHAAATWKCLQLLTSGAVWWEKESKLFGRSLERLSRCFCKSSQSISLAFCTNLTAEKRSKLPSQQHLRFFEQHYEWI